MAEPTHAENMVTKLEEFLLANAGLVSITISGQTVQLANLETKLAYWRRRVANANGKAPTVSRIRLDGF